jgi:hypothetical protein
MAKVHNILNNPWIAFPLMVLILVLFMAVGLKCASVIEQKVQLHGAKI